MEIKGLYLWQRETIFCMVVWTNLRVHQMTFTSGRMEPISLEGQKKDATHLNLSCYSPMWDWLWYLSQSWIRTTCCRLPKKTHLVSNWFLFKITIWKPQLSFSMAPLHNASLDWQQDGDRNSPSMMEPRLKHLIIPSPWWVSQTESEAKSSTAINNLIAFCRLDGYWLWNPPVLLSCCSTDVDRIEVRVMEDRFHQPDITGHRPWLLHSMEL